MKGEKKLIYRDFCFLFLALAVVALIFKLSDIIGAFLFGYLFCFSVILYCLYFVKKSKGYDVK